MERSRAACSGPGLCAIAASIALGLAALACTPEGPRGAPSSSASSPALASSAVASKVSPAPPWPELPRTGEAARALLGARARREATLAPAPPIDAALLLARAEAKGWSSLVAGEARIREQLQRALDTATREGRDAYLVAGSYHDAPGQIDAFRRLVGPTGLRGIELVAVEQLRATGAWSGAPSEAQRGDDRELEAFVERGDLDAFARLAARHRESDYAAWKFGYEAKVLDLLLSARATKTPLRGCDMPKETQALLGALADDERLRLRELHCFLSLGASTRPRRVALLWGQAHARPGAFRRFLPPDAAVISLQLFGFREGEGSAEHALREQLALFDPLLVPLDDAGSELALLLPDGPSALGVAVDRARVSEPLPAGLHLRSTEPAALVLGDRRSILGPAPIELALPEGAPTVVLESKGRRFVGALRVPPGTALEIEIDAPRRALTWIEHPAR